MCNAELVGGPHCGTLTHPTKEAAMASVFTRYHTLEKAS